eukprot:COSAG01_NODE_12921_length_1663_cov_0.970588_2_plen_306_part_00
MASRGGSGPAVPPAARSEAFASVYTRRSRNRFDDLAPLRSRVLPPNATARGAGAMDDTQSLASARWAEQLAATGTGPPDEAAPEGMWRTHKFRERFALKEGRVLQDDRYWSNVKQAHRERGEVWAPPRLTRTPPPPPGCCVRVEAIAGWLADRPPPPPAACPVLAWQVCKPLSGRRGVLREWARSRVLQDWQERRGAGAAQGPSSMERQLRQARKEAHQVAMREKKQNQVFFAKGKKLLKDMQVWHSTLAVPSLPRAHRCHEAKRARTCMRCVRVFVRHTAGPCRSSSSNARWTSWSTATLTSSG